MIVGFDHVAQVICGRHPDILVVFIHQSDFCSF